MYLRNAILAGLALAITGCTTTPTIPTNPLQARWGGKSAGTFFAAYGPPLSDTSASDGSTLYSWRGGYTKRRACQVELTVASDYSIRKIRTVVDHPDPKGGPTHCEKVLDAAS
ncbi:hypothetical protein [Sinorhizobium sp. BG8]|uniref:hypothetical protein n=1 Tax=Sinorhizobium sp. BG8 TaxID=2613773 RepID=UPI00193E8192|nr:hypothetical protein [Sinorhizobium sp. BG8]QRM56844.1 hypothetical protein F3Y30_08635 [Sinorhizobium sp. BG8]